MVVSIAKIIFICIFIGWIVGGGVSFLGMKYVYPEDRWKIGFLGVFFGGLLGFVIALLISLF